MEERQHADWLRTNQALLDEVTGRTRSAHPLRRHLPAAALGVLFVTVLVGEAWTRDYTAVERPSDWVMPTQWGLLGVAVALLLVGLVLLVHDPAVKTGLRRDLGRRMAALVRTADLADPEQRWWAASMARTLRGQRSTAFTSAGMVLLMLDLALGADLGMLALALLVGAMHLWLVLVAVRQDRAGRRVLRRLAASVD